VRWVSASSPIVTGRGNCLKLRQGRFKLDIRKKSPNEQSATGTGLPREVLESLSPEVFNKHLDAVLRNMV